MIGARLRQTRLAAGLTLEQLAAGLTRPLTRQALSKYETNKSEPSASTLMDIARVLGVKPSHLLSEPSVSVSWVGFRKHSSLRVREQAAITATATRRLESELELRTLFGIGQNSSLPRQIPVSDFDGAENAAQAVREEWGLSDLPINGLLETIEDRGGVVMAWEEDTTFDGLSGWTDGGHPVIVINAAMPNDRRRFGAAHELGHLVMTIDKPVSKLEKLAYRFAAAFLVPRESALRELGRKRRNLSMDELGLLKERWGLSMQAWVRRAYDLEVIDQGQYRSLNILFRRRSWYRQEPYQYRGTEEPLLLHRLVWRALTEGIITQRDAKQIDPSHDFDTPSAGDQGPSLRQIARFPREERHKLMAAATVEVDAEEVAVWDATTSDETDSLTEP